MKNNEDKIEISIVVPAYREEMYIEKTIIDISNVLSAITSDFEIICVVDGIVDETITILRKKILPSNNKVRAFSYKVNRGKGFALRYGFNKAEGKYIGFIDGDGQIEAESLATAYKIIKTKKCDIVVGSKKHKKSDIDYSLIRKFVSFFSQLFIKTLFNIGVSDTQAGVKLFRREVVKAVLPKLTIDRFAFDIEFLALAKWLGFSRIEEFPIKVHMLEGDNTGINYLFFVKDVFRSLKESLAIFINLKILKKYGNIV